MSSFNDSGCAYDLIAHLYFIQLKQIDKRVNDKTIRLNSDNWFFL